MSCPLCKAEVKSHWWYRDDLIYVCECISCRQPMVVIWRHAPTPTPEELRRAEMIVKGLFGEKARFRGYMRSIKDHWHEHVVR